MRTRFRFFVPKSVENTLLIVVAIFFLRLYRVIRRYFIPLLSEKLPRFQNCVPNFVVNLAPFVRVMHEPPVTEAESPCPALAVNRDVRRFQPFEVMDFDFPACLPQDLAERQIEWHTA